MNVVDFKRIFDREQIHKYLPYEFYDESSGIYINKDESVGLIIECYPLQVPYKKSYESLISLLSTLPEGATISIMLYASPDITNYIDKFRSMKMESEIVDNLTKFYEGKAFQSISPNFPSSIRDYRLLVSVKIGGKEREYSIFDKLFNPKLFFENGETKTIKDHISTLRGLKDKIVGALQSAYLYPRLLKPIDLHEFLYPILNPGHDYREKYINIPDTGISKYLVSNDTKIEVYEDYIKVDGVYGKSLAVKTYPEHTNFISTLFYVGNELIGAGFSNPFMIVLNAVKLPEKKKGEVKRNAVLVLNQQMPYALFPSLKLKHQDLTYGMERIEKGAELYDINLSVFVFGKDEEMLEKQVGSMKAYFRSLEGGSSFVLEEDKYINFAVFMSNLPFGYDLTVSSFLSRSVVGFAENVADLSPVVSDWKGTNPEVLFISSRGQIIGFDLFSSSAGGYNSYVVGTTGSGKSVLLQYIATNYYLSGNKVRIIDIGRSYERFAKIFDGQFIELNMSNPISLNPFSNARDLTSDTEASDVEFLINLFLLMGLPAFQDKALELKKLMKSYLDEAIKESWLHYGRESCVDTVMEFLNKHKDSRVEDFVKTLMPYSTKGVYGSFFNGESTLDLHADIVVMENDTIEQLPDLRDPALMLLTYHISQEIYLSHTDKKFIVIMDEAHKFLGNPQIDLFVEQAYRRFRKHGASIILGTQGFEDFYGGADNISTAGRVIVQNSYWKFFMLQTATSRQALKKSNYFDFNQYEEDLLDSILPVRGEYGEAYLISEMVKAKVRIVLDDYLKALYFSDPEIRRRIKELVDSGMSYIEATNVIMKEMKR